jgi:hypothetical protein
MADIPLSPQDEPLAAFLASPPPRAVPAAYRQSALAQSAPLTPALVIGGLGLISLVLTFAFFPRHLIADWQLSRPIAHTVPGHIQTATPTTISENHHRVMAYTFSFTPASGRTLTGVCYTTGVGFTLYQDVLVRYLPRDEAVACPVGGRLSETSPWSALIVIFPLFSAVFFAITLGSRREVGRLLKFGRLEEARVMTIGPPLDPGAGGRRNEASLQVGGELVAVPCHRVSLAEFLRERLESGTSVYLLRDPQHPQRVLFPERF